MSRLRLSYNLNLEQTQKLIMTPELRQAIQLLQYTSLELNEYILKELEENPMLELEQPIMETEKVELSEPDKEIDIDWKEYFEKYDDISYKPEIDKNIKEYNYESFVSYMPTLKEHLISQLRLIDIDDRKFKICEYIIQNIDDNGYLETDISEIAKTLNEDTGKVEAMLKIIQGLDPIGVGARDLEECLFLQVKEYNYPIIEDLIKNHLKDIAFNKMTKIAKEMELSLEDLQKACDFIKKLEPKPGRTYGGNSNEVKYIVPDATIKYLDGEYIIIVNDYTGPRLNINNFYKDLLKDAGDKETTAFLQEKLNSATWIIKSIDQRRQTIYKVVESILKHQMAFFEKGEKHLVPLTLKDVAEDIKMHESTISRATNGKYVETPRGLFELKYFFSAGLNSQLGDISSTSVKATIKEIIDNENHKKPYSDQQIVDLLKDKGTIISRRTVAKYRDELNIPSSTLRRRY